MLAPGIRIHDPPAGHALDNIDCACFRLADAGIALGCRTVLLKGVNDDPGLMQNLMRKLLAGYIVHQAPGSLRVRNFAGECFDYPDS